MKWKLKTKKLNQENSIRNMPLKNHNMVPNPEKIPKKQIPNSFATKFKINLPFSVNHNMHSTILPRMGPKIDAGPNTVEINFNQPQINNFLNKYYKKN